MDNTINILEMLLQTHFCDLKDTTEHETRLEKASNEYFRDKELKKYVKIYNSLADEKRLKILHLLKIREMCNCELTAAIKSSQPNLTYHIKKLENAGLINSRREGKYIYYSLNNIEKINNLLDPVRMQF